MTLAVPPGLGSAQPRWPYTARQVVWAALDLLFPPRCGGCRREGERFCESCRNSLAWIAAPICEQCGYPARPTEACPNCRRHPIAPLTGIRSVAFFEGSLQNALHSLKYRRDMILADSLAEVMARFWRAQALPGEVVVPVPLSAERLQERGYNQAGWLARGFAELVGLRYLPHGLRRIRHTVSQVGLTAEQRRANVADAFQARPEVAGRAVIVVDDVCTTGATLVACAGALISAGAAGVWGFTLGRAR